MTEHSRFFAGRTKVTKVEAGAGATGSVLFSEPLSSFFGAGTVFANDPWSAPLFVSLEQVSPEAESYGILAVSALYRATVYGDADGSIEQHKVLYEQIGSTLGDEPSSPAAGRIDNVAIALASGEFRVTADVYGGAASRITVTVWGRADGGPLA